MKTILAIIAFVYVLAVTATAAHADNSPIKIVKVDNGLITVQDKDSGLTFEVHAFSMTSTVKCLITINDSSGKEVGIPQWAEGPECLARSKNDGLTFTPSGLQKGVAIAPAISLKRKVLSCIHQQTKNFADAARNNPDYVEASNPRYARNLNNIYIYDNLSKKVDDSKVRDSGFVASLEKHSYCEDHVSRDIPSEFDPRCAEGGSLADSNEIGAFDANSIVDSKGACHATSRSDFEKAFKELADHDRALAAAAEKKLEKKNDDKSSEIINREIRELMGDGGLDAGTADRPSIAEDASVPQLKKIDALKKGFKNLPTQDSPSGKSLGDGG